MAGQIATIMGARAVGITSGPKKARRLLEELGYDAAVDRREELASQLAVSCPEARAQLASWLREGKISAPEYRLEGIETVAQAFCDLFAGKNFGKTIVAL